MKGFKCYKEYLAIQAHFRQGGDYDYFKYNGRVNASPESFRNHRNFYNFIYLEKKYGDNFYKYYLANLVNNDFKYYIQQLIRNRIASHSQYNAWCENINNMGDIFKQETTGLDIQKSIQCEKRKTPELVRLFVSDQISLETFSIIYFYYDLKNVLQSGSDDIMIADICFKVDKYIPFLKRELQLESTDKYRVLL